jgi:hypothetical protein
MKKSKLIWLVLSAVGIGGLLMTSHTQSSGGSGADGGSPNAAVLSNAGCAFKVGAVKMDGTNVPVCDKTIRVVQGANVPPKPNASKPNE